MAKRMSLLTRVMNSFSKNQKLTKKENSKAIMRARYSSSGKPIKQRYKDEKKIIIQKRNSSESYFDNNQSSFSTNSHYRVKNSGRIHPKRGNSAWKPKRNSIFDKINTKRNNEIIIKSSRFIVENILKISNPGFNKNELDNLSGFLSLVISESISLVFKEEVILSTTIKTYLSVGKKVYKVMVYINDKYEVSISDEFSFANPNDIEDYKRFNKQHLKAIEIYYGGLENIVQINDEKSDVMYEINGNLSQIENYNFFSHAIASVMVEFNGMFGSKIMSKYPLYIDNCNNKENANCGYTPIITPVLKQILVIKLGIDNFGDFAKTVFQLSHELCHYVFYSIKGIEKPLADIEEEKICSAMSLIILKALCDNNTFESYCNYVKELAISHYREGFFFAEELDFKKENIVKKIIDI